MSNLRQRILSALVLAAVVLTLTWLGGVGFPRRTLASTSLTWVPAKGGRPVSTW